MRARNRAEVTVRITDDNSREIRQEQMPPEALSGAETNQQGWDTESSSSKAVG
jgi:hypothetical protein